MVEDITIATITVAITVSIHGCVMSVLLSNDLHTARDRWSARMTSNHSISRYITS